MSYKDPIRRKEYSKEYIKAHKDELKAYGKAYYQAYKEDIKELTKAYYQANKEEIKEKFKAYRQAHKEEAKAYTQSDVNSLGQTKNCIRSKSNWYLSKYGTKIPGYEIHHCCTYTEPYKFIYCSRDMHKLIHSYMRQHNIDADSDHYDKIKHLLDDSVVKYGID